MPIYDNTTQNQWNAFNAGVIPNDIHAAAINYGINRTPLSTRLAGVPVGSTHITIVNKNFRPNNVVLTADATNVATTITVADSSLFDTDDVIQIEDEYLLVSGRPSATTVTVTRGYGGTTGAAHTAGSAPNQLPIYFVTNTRTGAAKNTDPISRIPQTSTQAVQTIMHSYSVGGALQADTNYVSAYGTPLDEARYDCMQMCLDDYERGAYYGRGILVTATTSKPMMTGMRYWLTTNNKGATGNLPTNYNAYKSTDFVRDTIQACYSNGGTPNLLLVSVDFLSAFDTWGKQYMRIPAGSNIFGTPIDLYEAPFLQGIPIVPAPLLRPGTAVCLNTNEVRNRWRRTMFEKPRGSAGDVTEGDMILDGAIEVANEAHHAWVSGITTFVKDS